MNLIPRDPFTQIDSWFDNFLPSFRTLSDNEGFFSPSVDIEEQDKQYLITADLPGVKKDDLAVTLEEGVLTIKAERSEEKEEKHKGKVIRRERRHGSFIRSFTVGNNISEKDIAANFKDGVLTLTLPKTKAQEAQAKRITVN